MGFRIPIVQGEGLAQNVEIGATGLQTERAEMLQRLDVPRIDGDDAATGALALRELSGNRCVKFAVRPDVKGAELALV